MRHPDTRTLSPDTQGVLRIKIVKAVQGGNTQTEAAKMFGVARETVSRLMCRYRKEGYHGLRVKRRGRPPISRLKGWEAANIVRLITDRCPEQLKLPFVLWTREAVQDLIYRRCKIRLSIWTIGRYLRKWGFTPQKPIRKAYERDKKQVERWLKEEYPRIRRLAVKEKAEIHWGDEMGMRSDHQTGTSWSPKGITPEIPGTGKRFRTNMISSITNRGKLAFLIFRGMFKAKVFLDFSKRLIRHRRRKIFLIVDSHPVHGSGEVVEWMNKNRKRIRMFFLPTYSPDLNPDEMLNQDVKSNALGRKRPRTLLEMEWNVEQYLTQRKYHPEIVQSYFHKPSVIYAAA